MSRGPGERYTPDPETRWRLRRSQELRGKPCPICTRPVTKAIWNEARRRWEYKHSARNGITRTTYCMGDRE